MHTLHYSIDTTVQLVVHRYTCIFGHAQILSVDVIKRFFEFTGWKVFQYGMDGVTKIYLKEQLELLGIKNLTEKELNKYTQGI